VQHYLSRYSSQCHALVRMVVGFLFLWHGAQKLFGFPSPIPGTAAAFITYGAGPIELRGGILVMVGLCTGWAARAVAHEWR
jgi:putative oxidoreductase